MRVPRTEIIIETCPVKPSTNSVNRPGYSTRGICVFNAENPFAIVFAGKEVVNEGCPEAAEVEGSGGGGGEAEKRAHECSNQTQATISCILYIFGIKFPRSDS